MYYAAVALNPAMKFEYFDDEWQHRPDWIERAKAETTRIWTRDYKGTATAPATGVSPGTRDFDTIDLGNSPQSAAHCHVVGP